MLKQLRAGDRILKFDCQKLGPKQMPEFQGLFHDEENPRHDFDIVRNEGRTDESFIRLWVYK